MSKTLKQWLSVRADGEGRVILEGREFTSLRKQYEGGECYMVLSRREADWLIGEIEASFGGLDPLERVGTGRATIPEPKK